MKWMLGFEQMQPVHRRRKESNDGKRITTITLMCLYVDLLKIRYEC